MEVIAVLVDIKVDLSKFEELKKIFGALRKTVLENEPGALVYNLINLRDGSCNCRIIEIYQDMNAVEIHAATDYLRKTRPKLMACLTDEPTIVIYDVVV